PWPDTRTSYQVGRPWMFEGKMLRVPTGTPLRSTHFANSSFALAEPEPLTLANLTTKSLVETIGCGMTRPARFRDKTSSCPRHRSDSVRRRDRSANKYPRPSP